MKMTPLCHCVVQHTMANCCPSDFPAYSWNICTYAGPLRTVPAQAQYSICTLTSSVRFHSFLKTQLFEVFRLPFCIFSFISSFFLLYSFFYSGNLPSFLASFLLAFLLFSFFSFFLLSSCFRAFSFLSFRSTLFLPFNVFFSLPYHSVPPPQTIPLPPPVPSSCREIITVRGQSYVYRLPKY